MTGLTNKELVEKLQYIFQYSVENGMLPIFWIDEEGLIIYHNRAVVDYVGEDNLVNTYMYRISSDVKKEDWTCLWDSLMKDGKHKFTFEFYNKRLDKIFTLNVFSSKIELDGTFYCHQVWVDITELVETNHKLSKEKMRVEESERLKNAFLSNVSHEIRTPMNAIVGFSDILYENVEERFRYYTKTIFNNVQYLLSLIDNIIMISRIDSDQVKIKYDVFDVLEILKELYNDYTDRLTKLDKDLTIVIDNTNSQLMESDKYIIEQSLHILIDNAIKFSTSGDIHMGFYIQDRNITIYVKDNGMGIENKYHEIIFDRFRKINKQTLGAGLGLSIFKSFMNLIGGKYNITSKLNDGTLMSMTMTLKSDPLKKSEFLELSDANNIEKLKGKRILVAEDLDVNQQLIHDMLLPYGVDIIKCWDGNECVEKCTTIKDIDLILMDLDMPYLDGYEATKIIRQKDKVIPIIAQTAYSQKENRERARRIGFNDFLTKPITKDKLLKIILKNLQ